MRDLPGTTERREREAASRVRPRVLLIHTHVVARGGGQAVAAWGIQALKEVVDLTVLCWAAPDCAGVDRLFGTALAAGGFHVETVAPALSRSVDAWPWPGRLLRRAILQRRCRQLDRRARYDVLLSTDNEFDFGRSGIQYVHCPDVLGLSRRERDSAFDRIPGLVAVYQALCARLGGWSTPRVRRNLTLANSEFTRKLLKSEYGIEAATLLPPVPGGFPDTAWAEREPGFAFIGRLHPGKRVLEAIDVVDRLRRRGHELRLVLFGTRDDPRYLQRVVRAAEARAGWIDLHVELPRHEMVELLARQRYGILGRREEPFGIAVAELLRAGCIPFVHDSGGAPEIVGSHPALCFSDEDDAVEKIDRLLHDAALEDEVRRALRGRKVLFSEDAFVRSMRRLVFEHAGHARPDPSTPVSEARP